MELAGVVLQNMLAALMSPIVVLPALLLGWLTRKPWQAVLGGVALAALLFELAVIRRVPESVSMVAAAVPLGLVAPVVWALATLYLRRWMHARDRASGGHGRSPWARAARTVLGGVAGSLPGALCGFGVGVLYVELANVSQFEGHAGYVAMFGFGTAGLVLGALAGMVLAFRWGRGATPPTSPRPHQRSRP